MTGLALLTQARAAGFRLSPRGDRLRVEPVPPPDLRAALTAAKPELLELLRAEAEPIVRHVEPAGRDCPCNSRVYLDLDDGARVCGRCGWEVAP